MNTFLKKQIKRSFVAAFCITTWFFGMSVSFAAPGSNLMGNVEYADGEAYHNEGDMVLTADYTLPEDAYLNWYSGSLTIASGATLTIPASSFLNISNPEDRFIVEEGATIRIEGAPVRDEAEEGENNPLCHLFVYGAETRIDGTIESENAGPVFRCNKVILNGTIHSAQQIFMTEQCQVMITGGEYLSEMKSPIKEVYTDFYESVIEISGGRFSSDKIKSLIRPEYTLEKQADGTFIVVLQKETENLTETADVSGEASAEDVSMKEKARQIWEYVRNLFLEVKQDSIQEDGKWVNGDVAVVVLCIATVMICLLLVIIDFIRSPLKKKLKIMIELVIAIGIVGGGIWFLWNQAQKELAEGSQAVRADKYRGYEENEVPEPVVFENINSELNGMEVYPEGIYLTGRDLEPGLYFFESNDPVYGLDKRPLYYVYSSKTPDFREKEVGAWVKRSYLELKEGSYIRVIGANFIRAGEQPVYEAEEKDGGFLYRAGEYLVGYDIEPGTYQMTVEPYDITIADTALDDRKINFTTYDGTHYENGSTEVTLREGQHIYVYVNVAMKLER